MFQMKYFEAHISSCGVSMNTEREVSGRQKLRCQCRLRESRWCGRRRNIQSGYDQLIIYDADLVLLSQRCHIYVTLYFLFFPA